MSTVEHLLGYVRGQLAASAGRERQVHGVMPVLLRLGKLAIHLRAPRPPAEKTIALAGEVLSDLATLLAFEAELADDEVIELFREAAGPRAGRTKPDLRAARADVSVATDHLYDLGRAVVDLASGRGRPARSLIESGSGVAGSLLTAVQRAAPPPLRSDAL